MPFRTPVERFSAASAEAGAALLETQRPGLEDRNSFLLRSPLKILSSRRLEDVPLLLEEAAAWQGRGNPVAGFLSYEAGYALEESLAREAEKRDGSGEADFPLAWFGIYGGALRFDHFRGRWSEIGPSPPGWPTRGEGADVQAFGGDIDPAFSLQETDHAEKVGAVRRAIADGDVYQANLTGKFSFPFDGDPFALYMRLRAVQPVRYGAFLRTEDGCVVSCSPELFFRVRGGRIGTRPMKGTASRGLTSAEDRRAAERLRADPKNRAENLMIVDLLRNDLGRVCLPGSVRVPRLFSVERYRTVLQMVSAVTGTLKPGTGLPSLMRALFPCGSVTGAPKISSMRLLRKVEDGPRGIYTGAVGILLPGGDMSFSVAIRTVAVKGGRAEAGSGGGIVWDSVPASEFGEAMLKGRYLVDPPVDFRLIETFFWSRETGFRFIADHLRRLSASAGYFGFRFRREAVRGALESAVRECRDAGARKIRLLLGKEGDVSVELSPLTPAGEKAAPLRVRMSKAAVSSRDPFVRHKTTNRAWRDEELRAAAAEGFDEVLFLNERGELTEGAVSNLFLETGGRLFTPPASCGLLEGVFRRRILADRKLRAGEKVLRPEDLEKGAGILLTNSVRGIRRIDGAFRHGA
ncbi:MAG: aminodeoxychorismate synthase component I [Thermodesulfobacteriota bacterium]